MDEQARVRDIMTTAVITVSEEDNLSQVAAGLERYRFHHLPVVDGNKLVGMLSQRDVLRNTVAGVDRSRLAQAREARFLEETFVRDVMQTKLVSARSEELISDVAERMLSARVGALPVLDESDELVGIVTEHDILRLVAKRGLLSP